jgi:hypothetical protein
LPYEDVGSTSTNKDANKFTEGKEIGSVAFSHQASNRVAKTVDRYWSGMLFGLP